MSFELARILVLSRSTSRAARSARSIAFVAATALGLGGCAETATRANIHAAESAPEVVRLAPDREAFQAPPRDDGNVAAGAADEAIFERAELPDLEAAALVRHPELAAAAHRVRALAERARAEAKLPPPELMGQIWQVPFARPYALDKAAMIMISLRQTIPAGSSLDRMAEATSFEARAEAAKLAAQARALVHDVDRAYADYVEAVEQHAAHMRHRSVLGDAVAAVRARYATSGSLSDVAKADLERAKVDAEMERERGMVAVARARLNGLLSRPVDAPLGAPHPAEVETADVTPGKAAELAAAANPDAGAAEMMEKAAGASAAAAREEATVPVFSVSIDGFLPVNDTPAGYGTSLSMSLPWLWGPGTNRVRSAEQQALAARASARGARLRVRSDAVTALAAVRAAERRYLVLTKLALPAAGRALDAARAGYVGGSDGLLSWIDSARMSLDVATDVVNARAELDRALADLDWAAGGRVPRIPIAASREQLHQDELEKP